MATWSSKADVILRVLVTRYWGHLLLDVLYRTALRVAFLCTACNVGWSDRNRFHRHMNIINI
jgi:hypothetical protein